MTHEHPTTSSGEFDPFEQELRRALGNEAADPAPERLIARIAAIPTTSRVGSGGASGARGRLGGALAGVSPSRFRLGLAAVGAAVIIIVAGSVLVGRFGAPPDVGNQPSGPIGPSPSAPAEVASPSPGGSSTEPSPTPAPSSVGPFGGPIPADFQPASATFTSPKAGWLLGSATCAGAPCAAIVRSTDGGLTWAGIPAPDAAFVAGGVGSAGVSGLRFADALNGWAFGPELWSTHDGGTTWRRVSLPGSTSNLEVMTMETAAGAVHAVYFDGGGSGLLTIATSPVATDAWVASPTTVELGAGPVPHPQMVLSGTAGWLIEVDRAVIGGARLVSGAWTAWTPPCLTVNGPATLAAASSTDLVAACDVGLWSDPKGVHVFLSPDGGATFSEAASKVPVTGIDAVGAPTARTALVAGTVSGPGSTIVGSFDGGATWAQVHAFRASGSLALGFMTAQDGFALSSSGDGVSELLMTHDGGQTWATVAITGG